MYRSITPRILGYRKSGAPIWSIAGASPDDPSNEQVEDSQEESHEAEGDASDSDDASQEDDKEEAWDPQRAKRKIAKLNSEAANLRKRVQEAPKADDVAAKDKRITELESLSLRYEVGFGLGLPKEIVSRLRGNTREEILADAEALVELIAPAKRPPAKRPAENLRGGGDPEREPEETDLSKIGARMFRN